MGYTPPQLEVRKISGGYQIYAPGTVTTEDLTISPNAVDTYSKIVILGNGGINLYSASGVYYFDSMTESLKIIYTDPDLILESRRDTKNLYLKTTGTGVVKFGTYTAGAATDSTGYISILDAAGNARKLMVQA